VIVLWIAATVAGFAIAVLASRWALGFASELAAGSALPPFFIGVTLLAIGTDLPEIANSITASVGGHGDVNVGDSLGSAATQVTLVLGLLPFLARPVDSEGRGHVLVGALTAAALVLCAVLLADGHLGRLDGAALVTTWLLGSWWLLRRTDVDVQLELPQPHRRRSLLVAGTLVSLVIVGGGAILAVTGVIQLAEAAGIPEFIISYFGASLGTSLPELVVAVTAMRRGQAEFALGDALGASFADATLSIGIGPLIAPTAVTAALAVRGALAALVAVVIATALLAFARRHDWRTGLLLLVTYGALFVVVL
jgi:cation:H+ antiporter